MMKERKHDKAMIFAPSRYIAIVVSLLHVQVEEAKERQLKLGPNGTHTYGNRDDRKECLSVCVVAQSEISDSIPAFTTMTVRVRVSNPHTQSYKSVKRVRYFGLVVAMQYCQYHVGLLYHYAVVFVRVNDRESHGLVAIQSLMPTSHCPEVGTRWTHEYGILNFARRLPRSLIVMES